MEENTSENKEAVSQNNLENKGSMNNKSQSQIAGAIIIAGIIIAGAVFLKGTAPTTNNAQVGGTPLTAVTVAKVGANDRTLGNPNAKVTLVLYEDFQCPFCERFFTDAEKQIRDNYLPSGQVQLVYRDFAFLGPESERSAEAARCAGDQGKFWEYHDYLFTHQNGENKGSFADNFLKSFGKTLGLDTTAFNQCLSSNKYAQAVADSKAEAATAGVNGTPKGFLVTTKDISTQMQNAIKALPQYSSQAISFYSTKNIVSLNGALPSSTVNAVLDILLK